MKKSELKQIIREEYRKVLKEDNKMDAYFKAKELLYAGESGKDIIGILSKEYGLDKNTATQIYRKAAKKWAIEKK